MDSKAFLLNTIAPTIGAQFNSNIWGALEKTCVAIAKYGVEGTTLTMPVWIAGRISAVSNGTGK
jgi:DNA/RNA endonuclease G (NUC1)